MGSLSYGGNATGVVYGFLKDIITLKKRFETNYIVFCWDYGKGIRKLISSDYKSNRHKDKEDDDFEISFKKQVTLLRTEYLKQIGFRNIFYQDGYESDDIIASVCRNLPDGDKGIIVSADHDLYQLLTANISMYNPQKKI